MLSDRDVFDVKLATATGNAVKNLWKKKAVDDMTADFNFFNGPIGCVSIGCGIHLGTSYCSVVKVVLLASRYFILLSLVVWDGQAVV